MRPAGYAAPMRTDSVGDVGAVLRAARLTAGVGLTGMAVRTRYSGETDAAKLLGDLAPLLQAVIVGGVDDSPAPDRTEALIGWARTH